MAQADPAAEYPAAALALDMQLVAQGPDGERVIDADDFFVTYLTTDLEPGELLTEVRIPPVPPGTGWSFQELARRHGDFAMVGVLVTLRVEGGVCAGTRIVTFGVADRAHRMTEAEALVDGQAPEVATFERAAAKVAEEIEDPMSDVPCLGRVSPGHGASPHTPGPRRGPRPRELIRARDPARPRREEHPNRRHDPMTTARQVRMTVNGVTHEALVDPRTTLVDFLRHELALTGTHVGCEHGVCGVCNVLLDGKAVRSCLTLAVQADGSRS